MTSTSELSIPEKARDEMRLKRALTFTAFNQGKKKKKKKKKKAPALCPTITFWIYKYTPPSFATGYIHPSFHHLFTNSIYLSMHSQLVEVILLLRVVFEGGKKKKYGWVHEAQEG